MKLSRKDSELIHSHTALHREEIENSSLCWCISCERSFPPSEIDDWTDNEQTAFCPYCYIDAVVGDASGFELTPQLIHRLNKIWF